MPVAGNKYRVVSIAPHSLTGVYKNTYGDLAGFECINTGEQFIMEVKSLKNIDEFDPAAEMAQQYTRDGQKVVALYDSGLNAEFPMSVWLEGGNAPLAYTKKGRFNRSDENDSTLDIITRPPPKPLEVRYLQSFLDSNKNFSLRTWFELSELRSYQSKAPKLTTLRVERHMFDPNTGTLTVTEESAI